MNRAWQTYWQGKSVLITGASSGLGEAVVEALAPYGVKFCLLARRKEKLQALADRLKDSGSSFWFRSVDVRDREAVQAAVQDFSRETGHLDVAWINAGISADTSFRRWDWQKLEDVLDTNLKGAIYATKACLDIMVPQRSGVLVGIGSAASMRGMPARSAYSLSKIALEYFFESMAAELPQLQFTVIHPGFVDTPLNKGNPIRFWLMQPDRAAKLMIRAVMKKKFVYIYPFRMRLLYGLVRAVPRRVFLALVRKAAHLARPPAKRVESYEQK